MTEYIHFQLDQPASQAHCFYRPWGTTTLKVKVTTAAAMPPLRMRPRHIPAEEYDRGLCRGYADDSRAFVVSWGGGHEPGPCVRSEDFLMAFERCAGFAPEDTSVLFFNVNHVGPDVPAEAMVTLEAFVEESGEVVAALPIQLQRLSVYQADAVQFDQLEPGQWQARGRSLPVYASRWWPEVVDYVPTNPLPLLIQREHTTLYVQWDERVVATVTDYTEPTILAGGDVFFELFHFDAWHVALRLWFYWLDKRIGGDFFIGRHEVPDAERFDMLIRQRDGQVTLACTDLHWREVWGRVTAGEPLRATLGLDMQTKLKLAEEALGKAWAVWRRDETADHQRPYNPINYIRRMAARLGQEDAGTVRAQGSEAHLPSLQNVEQVTQSGRPPKMTSSDVRLG